MEQKVEEQLYVDSLQELSYKMSAGSFLTRYYVGIRDEGKIWANKCPKCGIIVFPPRNVCVFCKVTIEDKEKNWVELSDKGTIISAFTISRRDIEPFTGEMQGLDNAHIYIKPDGGDDRTILVHFLDSKDTEKAKPGMRVQAVWKPKEQRVGRLTDIQCFKLID